MASFGQMFRIGCGSNSCVWGPGLFGGVATNGPCHCYERPRKATRDELEAYVEMHSGIRLLRELAELPKVQRALAELVRLTTTPPPTKDTTRSADDE